MYHIGTLVGVKCESDFVVVAYLLCYKGGGRGRIERREVQRIGGGEHSKGAAVQRHLP